MVRVLFFYIFPFLSAQYFQNCLPSYDGIYKEENSTVRTLQMVEKPI